MVPGLAFFCSKLTFWPVSNTYKRPICMTLRGPHQARNSLRVPRFGIIWQNTQPASPTACAFAFRCLSSFAFAPTVPEVYSYEPTREFFVV